MEVVGVAAVVMVVDVMEVVEVGVDVMEAGGVKIFVEVVADKGILGEEEIFEEAEAAERVGVDLMAEIVVGLPEKIIIWEMCKV